jgi:sporulation protein YlmC with PRC-barrel domain
MFNSISHITGARIAASDGDIGRVKEAYFDDRAWVIRYLVVETGSWLNGREVLVSPYAVEQPVGGERQLHVALTQQQVRSSPAVDTQRPVSRQHERELLRHYRHPEYWDGGGLWAMGAMPGPPMPNTAAEVAANRAMLERDARSDDVHLRSSAQVTGYEIQARDESIGSVQDFVFDDATWAIRYLVVDTSAWWQGGKPVLVGVHWAERIDWATRKVHVRLTREEVRRSPVFQDVASIHRDYEMRLHQNYQRQGYWL